MCWAMAARRRTVFCSPARRILARTTGAMVRADCGRLPYVGAFAGTELNDLVFSGPRLTLRPWILADAPAVHAALRTGELPRFLPALPWPHADADAERFVS